MAARAVVRFEFGLAADLPDRRRVDEHDRRQVDRDGADVLVPRPGLDPDDEPGLVGADRPADRPQGRVRFERLRRGRRRGVAPAAGEQRSAAEGPEEADARCAAKHRGCEDRRD